MLIKIFMAVPGGGGVSGGACMGPGTGVATLTGEFAVTRDFINRAMQQKCDISAVIIPVLASYRVGRSCQVPDV